MENFSQQSPRSPLSLRGSLEPPLPTGMRPCLLLGLEWLSHLQIQVHLQAAPSQLFVPPRGPHTVLTAVQAVPTAWHGRALLFPPPPAEILPLPDAQ